LFFGGTMLLDMAICKFYDVMPLNSIDKNVWYDQTTNRCNIMSMVVLERTTDANLHEIFVKRMHSQYVRMRCKMVKIGDQYYFKEMFG